MAIDYESNSSKVLSPAKLAHIVLRTGQFQAMTEYYKTFLGAKATYENDFLSFLTYDDEHHRIAIAGVPGTGAKVLKTAGLEHVAFTFNTMEELLLSYRQRKAANILPAVCINHGPTTSIYYTDPDGNQIETQVDNFDTAEEATDFMSSKGFAENPIGVDFDPEDYIARLKAGESVDSLKKRPEIGPRGFPG